MRDNDLRLWLRSLDADKLRQSVDGMRQGLSSVVQSTNERWTEDWRTVCSGLVEVARVDLCLARLVEGHADAMRIIDQSGALPRGGVYGVWASRSAGTGLRAEDGQEGWRLSGELRFASGIDLIQRALLPGWVDGEHHLLFDVAAADVRPDRGSWAITGMDAARSFTCVCKDLAVGPPLGPEDFYLGRAGFLIGGIGPAAVWTGGAHLVTDLVTESLAEFTSTHHQKRRLGAMAQATWLADTALERAVSSIEGAHAESDVDVDAAKEVSHARTAIVSACDTVMAEAALVVGPGGLSGNARLARALADLQIYVRQQHLDAALHSYGQDALRQVGAG